MLGSDADTATSPNKKLDYRELSDEEREEKRAQHRSRRIISIYAKLEAIVLQQLVLGFSSVVRVEMDRRTGAGSRCRTPSVRFVPVLARVKVRDLSVGIVTRNRYYDGLNALARSCHRHCYSVARTLTRERGRVDDLFFGFVLRLHSGQFPITVSAPRRLGPGSGLSQNKWIQPFASAAAGLRHSSES